MNSHRTILFTGTNTGQRTLGQGLASPWLTALENGYVVKSSFSSGSSPDILICVDWNRSCRRLVLAARRKTIKTVLIVLEPSIVFPDNSSPRVRGLFDLVLEVGRPFSRPSLPWPQTWHEPPQGGHSRDDKRAVMIQSAKHSFVAGQLYGLRASFAHTNRKLDVFGHDWQEPYTRRTLRVVVELLRAVTSKMPIDLSALRTSFLKPRNYLGPVENKFTTMSKYRVAIVIENSQEYMSEKFFDALFSGCIPVYVGPNLTAFGIPANLYIQADANNSSLSLAMDRAFEIDYSAWIIRCQSFLANSETKQLWEEGQVNQRLLDKALSSTDR